MSDLGSNTTISSTNDPKEAQRARVAWNISLGTGLLMGVISIATAIITIQTGLNSFAGIILTAWLALLAFISIILQLRKKINTGMYVLLIGLIISSLSIPVIADGQGVAYSITVAILITSLASATLPEKPARYFTIAGIIAGVIIAIVDLFLPNLGFPTDPRFSAPIAIIIAVIYAGSFLRRFSTYSLRTKLILSFILVAIVPLVILGIYNSYTIRTNLTRSTEDNLTEKSRQAAITIENYLNAQLDVIRTESQQPGLKRFLETSSTLRKELGIESNALETMQSFVRKDPVFIRSYAILDTKGKNLLDTQEMNIGKWENGNDYFKIPSTNGEPYVSNIQFTEEGNPSLVFSAPIRDQFGNVLGILRAEYNALAIQNIAINLVGQKTQEGESIIVLNLEKDSYVTLADSSSRTRLFKSIRELSDEEIAILQTGKQLPAGEASTVLAPETELYAGLLTLATKPTFTIALTTTTKPTIFSTSKPEGIPWMIITGQEEELALGTIEQQTRTIVLVSMLLIALAASAGYAVSTFLTGPVSNLIKIAQQVASGDLSAQAQTTSQDEIGDLARTFNLMTGQLRETLGGLEQRVAIRTADLETARLTTEKRVRDMQIISEVSRAISIERDVERLMPMIAQLVSEQFGFYHVGIFLLDTSKRYAMLQAANSEGGKRMLERSHRLEVGQRGLVGYVSLSGTPRIALDVGEDAVFFNNPDLPDTRSEMALPLKVRNETIGVLDVQSIEGNAFTEEDIKTLSILADQIAIAIENTRLLARTREALARAEKIFQKTVAQNWQASTQLHSTGYEFAGLEVRPLNKPIESPDIFQAATQGQLVNTETPEENSLAIPVKLGNQVICVLRASSRTKDKTWEEHELAILRSIADRIALALENARLVQASQNRAMREKSIAEMAARIGAATNIDEIVETAVKELGKNLANTKVFIQLSKPTAQESSEG